MTLRVFVSSPGDVGEERRTAERVLERLAFEFGGKTRIEPLFWEHEPLRATDHFQAQLPLPSESDIVVVILWSRLGTRLPSDLRRNDGSTYASGTEFEFEDAWRSFEAKGTPDLLVYRKTATPFTALDSEDAVLDRLEQKKALDAFIERWFKSDDGSFQAAFHQFETPADFEEALDTHLRRLIEAQIEQHVDVEGAEPPTLLWTRGSPFRGLQHFEPEHAPVFCGRTHAVSEVIDALRRQAAAGHPFVLVTGMSGCGKSSLMGAGVISQLGRPGVIEGVGLWRHARMRPTDRPSLLAGLTAALLAEDALPEMSGSGDAETLARDFAGAPQGIVPLVRGALTEAARQTQAAEHLDDPPDARVLLVIDQLEELFTAERLARADRQVFATALAALVGSGSVWVVAAMRSDYYDHLEEVPELLALKEGGGQYDLRPPTPDELAQMIRVPARIAGLTFETRRESGERLDDVLRDAAVNDPEALPLLEFTLEALYAQRTEAGALTFAAYEAIGGLEGALARHADDVFEGLSEAARGGAQVIFSRLVRVGLDDEQPVRRRVDYDRAVATPAGKELVEAFVEARLFVVDRAEDGTAVLTIAHEALLSRWPRIATWIESNRDALQSLTQIAAAAVLWDRESRDTAFLLPKGETLEEGEDALAGRSGELDALEREFVEASLAADRGSRSRRLIVWAGVGVALIAIAIGAWLYVDANFVTHVERSRMAMARFGIREPFGTVPDGVPHLRFYRRGGRTLRVEQVNARGALDPRSAADPGTAYLTGEKNPLIEAVNGPCVFEYDYYENDEISDEVARGKYGQVLWHVRFPRGHTTRERFIAQFVDEEDLARPRSPSGAAFVEITRSPTGRPVLLRFLDRDRNPSPDARGRHGLRLEYDDRDWPRKMISLDAAGEPTLDSTGAAEMRLRFNSLGLADQIEFRDTDGEPTWATVGDSFTIARLDVTYDSLGRSVSIRAFDPEGEPYNGISGLAEVRTEYDAHGNSIKGSFFNARGRPGVTSEGVAAKVWTYDERGFQTSERWLDIDGGAARNGYAISALRYETNAEGDMVRIDALGSDGEPVTAPGGWSSLAMAYDDRGLITETIVLGTDGKPVLANGAATTRHEYDAYGRQIHEAWFDVQDRPIRLARGHAQARTRDTNGNVTATMAHDVDGTPCFQQGGYCGTHQEYDRFGRATRTTYVDVKGNPVVGPNGTPSVEVTLDRWGRTVETTFIGPDDRPAFNFQVGYASERTSYDERGNAARVERLDLDGRLIVSADGWAIRTRDFDEYGEELVERYFADEGLPIAVEGYASVHRHRDDVGFVVRREYRAIDGSLGAELGFAVVELERDAAGQVVVKRYRKADGSLVGAVRRTFDQWGRKVSETTIDASDNPVVGTEGYAEERFEFASGALERRVSTHDLDGGLVAPPGRGYAVVEYQHDARGNLIRTEYKDTDEQVVAPPDNNAIVTRDHDTSDRLIEMAAFDPEGARVRLADWGVHRLTIEYDERGHQTAVHLWPERNDAEPSAARVARVVSQVDPLGNTTRVERQDADGKPVPGTGSWPEGAVAQETLTDVRGRLVRQRFVDAAGATMDGPGFDDSTSRYSPPEGAYEQRSLDLSGLGFVRRFDEHRRLVEERFEDAAGDLLDLPQAGWAQAMFRYDTDGHLAGSSFHKADGSRVPEEELALFVTQVTPGGQAGRVGIRGGDLVERYGDQRPDSLPAFLDLSLRGDPGYRELVVRRNGEPLTFQIPKGLLGIDLRPGPRPPR